MAERRRRLDAVSDAIVRKTFANTTQLISSVEVENSDYPKQGFQIRCWPLRARNLIEKCVTNTMEWTANNVRSHGQIFLLQRSLYVRFYPIDSPRYTRHAYTDFINDVGAPTNMVSDGAQAENKCKKTQRTLRLYAVPWSHSMTDNQH